MWKAVASLIIIFLLPVSASSQEIDKTYPKNSEEVFSIRTCFNSSEHPALPSLGEKLDKLKESSVFVWGRAYITLKSEKDDKAPPETLASRNPRFLGWGQVVEHGENRVVVTVAHLVNLSEAEKEDLLEERRNTTAYKDLMRSHEVADEGIAFFVSEEKNPVRLVSTEILHIQNPLPLQLEHDNGTVRQDGFAILRLPGELDHLSAASLGSANECLGSGSGMEIWKIGGARPFSGGTDGADVDKHGVSNVGSLLFKINPPIYPGDSGSGTFALHRSGKIKLIGLVIIIHEAELYGSILPYKGLVFKAEPIIEHLRTNRYP